MNKLHYLATILLIMFMQVSVAKDLGVIGPMYEITERDMIESIQEKLRTLQNNGELKKIEEDYRKRVVGGIERPRPVAGIHPTQTARTYYIDPTFTLDRDVKDEQGGIMYSKGTQINPLDYAGLNQVLIFFDGDVEEQRKFVLNYLKEEKLPVKPILIAGAPIELMREWKREVFFDQGGVLSRHFNISASPATVRQEGKRLRIDEIRP